MRIKINLNAEGNIAIPIEYNYNIFLNLSQTLFSFLEQHKRKLRNKYKRNLPPFTFSQLMIPERKVELGFIEVKGNFLALFVSSVDNTFMEYLVKSLNAAKEFQIFDHRFPIKKIEVQEEPEFASPMRFKMLSPMLLVTVVNRKPRYLLPEDSDLSDVFARQLVGNYNSFSNGEYQFSDIKFIPDQDYMERNHNLTKAINIQDIHYKTIFLPFSLEGETELIKFAYNNGVGAGTQNGFGMIEPS